MGAYTAVKRARMEEEEERGREVQHEGDCDQQAVCDPGY